MGATETENWQAKSRKINYCYQIAYKDCKNISAHDTLEKGVGQAEEVKGMVGRLLSSYYNPYLESMLQDINI